MSAIIKYIRYIPMSEHKASLKMLVPILFITGSSAIAFSSWISCSDDWDVFSVFSPWWKIKVIVYIYITSHIQVNDSALKITIIKI